MRIAAYITGHGYGHARRGSLILRALYQRIPQLQIFVKTTAPRWLFRNLTHFLDYNQIAVDVAPVQDDAFDLNVHDTVKALNQWIMRNEDWTHAETSWLKENHIDLVISDISPWVSPAAHRAGIPSVLIANFTWDWIYSNLSGEYNELESIIPVLSSHYSRFDWVFVPEPAAPISCNAYPISVGMIGEQCQYSREDIRKRLSLPNNKPVVLITFGGIGARTFEYEKLNHTNQFVFLSTEPRSELKHCIAFDPRTVDHSCLVQAADIVVGKLGYGTVVESIIHGTPILYTARDNWPENRILADSVHDRLPARILPRERFFSCDWLDPLNALMGDPGREPQCAYGADQIATILSRGLTG